MGNVPESRLRDLNLEPPNRRGAFVLYRMRTACRTRWNFALQRAVDWAKEYACPLVVLEVLPCGRRWDSERLHRFALDGLADNARRLAATPVTHYPFVERRPGQGTDLLRALAARAVLVVADEFPCLDYPATLSAAAAELPCFAEGVDSNGLLPLAAAPKAFTTAYAFRRFLQRELPSHLATMPKADPLSRLRLPPLKRLPREITGRWPPIAAHDLAAPTTLLADLPINHAVTPADVRGGERASRAAMDAFVRKRLARYAEDAPHPDLEGTSGLSPYLHYGHVSAHEIVARIMKSEGWSAARLSGRADGRRRGWWGMSESAEAFLDQLVTWRELGYVECARNERYDRYESLPDWARATLERHRRDRREPVYALDDLDAAGTHDAVWNAAQRQLCREGRLHNALRMLWGKKILQWSASPEEALETMIELNNRYALDGRNPNSYSGIFWVLGRYDHPWGPERPVFGKVRYMSSENTARKLRQRLTRDHYGTGI